jgi:predicted DNA-binding transcriptional regulator YafY
MARATDVQKAERLNLARTLLQEHDHLLDAAERLAGSCSISRHQAYRYLEHAKRLTAPVPVGDAKVAVLLKLSRSLVQRLRMSAASTGLTMSETVSRALVAALNRVEGPG